MKDRHSFLLFKLGFLIEIQSASSSDDAADRSKLFVHYNTNKFNLFVTTISHLFVKNNNFPFYVFCPYPVRVGSVNDGGKYVCNPSQMPREHCR